MQCSTNRSCCRVFIFYSCWFYLCYWTCFFFLFLFGSLLAVCVVGLCCNVGLCCKSCVYLLSVTIVVFCMSSIFVTSFKDVSQQLVHYCEKSIHKQLWKQNNLLINLLNLCLCKELFNYPKVRRLTCFIFSIFIFHILDFGRSLGIYVYARAAVGKKKK